MISCRLLLVAFVLLNVAAFARRDRIGRKFDQPINQPTISNESSVGSRLHEFGVGFNFSPTHANCFCCWSPDSGKCYASPEWPTIKWEIESDPPGVGFGRFDLGHSREGPLMVKEIPLLLNRFAGCWTLRYASSIPATVDFAVSYRVNCGDGFRTHWKNFTKSWFRPDFNPQPTVAYWGPTIVPEANMSSQMLTIAEVHWEHHMNSRGHSFDLGGMNFIQGGSHSIFWIEKPGKLIPIILREYDRLRFHPYNHSPEDAVVWPIQWVHPWSGSYYYETYLVMHRCYQDIDGIIWNITRYEEHINYETYLVGDFLHRVYPENIEAIGFGAHSMAQWNYSSRVDWDPIINSWKLAPGPHIKYTSFNDTFASPVWNGTTTNITDRVGVVYRKEGSWEKCFCEPGSPKCDTRPMPPAFTTELYHKPSHRYKPAIRV